MSAFPENDDADSIRAVALWIIARFIACPNFTDHPGKRFLREFEVQHVFFHLRGLGCGKEVVLLLVVRTDLCFRTAVIR